ncbi:MAG: hypothetical protein ACFB4J_06380 [Elainellaceae cyanobacterium]
MKSPSKPRNSRTGGSTANFFYDRLISSLSPAARADLTDEQEMSLRKACQSLTPRDHALDVRLSIPLLGIRGVYLVLLGGREKRTPQRIQRERALFWQMAVISALWMIVGTSTLSMYWAVSYLESSPEEEVMPWSGRDGILP